MCPCGTVSLLLLLLTAIPLLNGQETSTTKHTTEKSESSSTGLPDEDYDPKNAYCFEFTWLGPSYDNTIEFDKNCEDFLSESHISQNGLCRQPFVITNDSTLPDLQHLWMDKVYKTRVVRRQRKGEVCARFTYSFNDEVLNITYLRTKVFAENEGAVTSGCYTQEHGGTASELCVCVPVAGDYFPCNTAAALSVRLWHATASIAAAALACTLTRRLI